MNKDIYVNSPAERRNWIENVVENKGKVDIEELATVFGVSTMTIRRDLAILEDQNKVIRTHGGAVAQQTLIAETPYARKETVLSLEKRAIAKKAATFVPKGATIMVDSGTTTMEMIRLLKHRDDLTVVTNDIKIAAELVDAAPQCIVTGGVLQPQVGALYGPQAEELLRQIHVDIFFLGAHAVDHSGVTAPTFEKAIIKKLMINAAHTTWLICDSSKFHHKSFAAVCNLSELEGIITDNSNPSLQEENAFHENMIFVSTDVEGGPV